MTGDYQYSVQKCQRCQEFRPNVMAYHGGDDWNYYCPDCAACACDFCIRAGA